MRSRRCVPRCLRICTRTKDGNRTSNRLRKPSGVNAVRNNRTAALGERTHRNAIELRTTLDITETTFSELANRARALATEGARTVLGITGAPGAGKTTLAERLVCELGPEIAVLVSMDGYHLANTVLHDLNRHPRKGAWDTFDAHGYVQMIGRIRAQRDHVSQGTEGTIYAPHFRRDLEEPVGSAVAVRPETPLVITEGNYLLLDVEPWAQARRVIDHFWFLAPPQAQRY